MRKVNKIQFQFNPDTNYVYHMLSVATCGYDNAYGAQFRSFHAAADLAILKKYQEHITIQGGVHNGRLYWHLVAVPARGEISADAYYRAFRDLFLTRNAADSVIEDASCLIPEFADLSGAILEICNVMIRNYDIYLGKVWPQTRQELASYIPPLDRMFEENHFTELAEKALATDLEQEAFYVVFTNAISGGPEAIDISPIQDVFDIHRPARDAYSFIAHEYVIYLLKSALRGTNAFQSLDTWAITEALAEFYLIRITGSSGLFTQQADKAAFYQDLAFRYHAPGRQQVGEGSCHPGYCPAP